MNQVAKTLIAYYSQTGNAKAVAESLAKRLGADLDEVKEDGACGADPSGYELVVVGTPVNGFQASKPIQAYLAANRGRFRKAAFYATYALWTAGTFGGMEKQAGCKPVATEGFKTPGGGDKKINMADAEGRIEAFAERLRKA